MNPVKYDLIERKALLVSEELKLIQTILKNHGQQLGEELVKHALLHTLQVAISAIIDISQHLCVELDGHIPENYFDAIEHLGELGILPKEFASDFARVAKLRNVLVHLYENVNYDFLWSLLPKFVADSQKFLKHVQKIK